MVNAPNPFLSLSDTIRKLKTVNESGDRSSLPDLCLQAHAEVNSVAGIAHKMGATVLGDRIFHLAIDWFTELGALADESPRPLSPDEDSHHCIRCAEIARDLRMIWAAALSPYPAVALQQRGLREDRDQKNADRSAARWKGTVANEKIRQYAAKHSDKIEGLQQAIRTARSEADRSAVRRKARQMFGRNQIAKALAIPAATVSGCGAWKAINEALFSDRAETTHPRKRIGLDMAVEKASIAKHDAEADAEADEAREREELRQELDDVFRDTPDAVDDQLDKLQRGKTTPAAIRELIELQRNFKSGREA